MPVGLALLLIACRQAPKPPPRATPQVLVSLVQPRRLTLQSELPGRTSAYQVADVRPQVGGLIRSRLFTEGARVLAGQVLYQIDPAPFQASLEQAEAALASARAAARVAELLVQRYRTLLPDKSISQQDFDNAEASYMQAAANVRQQEALVNSARINLQWTRITAPIAGNIGHSVVTPGALVGANQATALTTIAQLDPIYVDLTQSSAEVLRLRKAAQGGRISRADPELQKVSLIMEDGSTYPLEGHLQLSEVTVDPTTGSVLLRAVFPNPEGLLLPGAFVRAVIAEGVVEQAVLVPQRAVTRDRVGGASVRIVNAQNQIEVRAVTAGRSVGTDWLISAGLAAGDRVVLEGASNLPPGTPVEVVDGSKSPAAPRAP